MGINCKWEADGETKRMMSLRKKQIKTIKNKITVIKKKIKDLEKRRDEQIENLINFEYETQCTVLGSLLHK
jgi:archaellum component FlaC